MREGVLSISNTSDIYALEAAADQDKDPDTKIVVGKHGPRTGQRQP